jgi:uncharacterized protein YjbI with pentapeptide repeats
VLSANNGGGSEFAVMSDGKKTTQVTSTGSAAKHKTWRKRLLIAAGVVVVLGAGWIFWSILPLRHEDLGQHLNDVGIWIGFHSGSWLGDHSRPLTGAFVAVLLAVAIFAIWKVPHWQVAHSQGLSAANRFERENEARTTLAQIIGGVFLLAGLYSSIQTFDLQREGQITDRYTKAIEQLGAVLPGTPQSKDGVPAPNLTVRLGGIYALERISRDSPKDRATIMEVLSAYVRENAPATTTPSNGNAGKLLPDPCNAGAKTFDVNRHPREDIQAVLTVIGRQANRFGYDLEPIDLSKTSLSGADIARAMMPEVNLSESLLENAGLASAVLPRANLVRADLDYADLEEASLERSVAEEVCFHQARLIGTYFQRADLTGAHLEGALLTGAHLQGAVLESTHLEGADLSGATGLTQEQLNSTFGDEKTQLPDGLTRPSSWH